MCVFVSCITMFLEDCACVLFHEKTVLFLVLGCCEYDRLCTETIVDHQQGDVTMMSWCMPVGRMCLRWLIAAPLCTPSPETSTALSKDKHID